MIFLFNAEEDNMKLEGKKINFLGDSITFGFGLLDLPELPENFDPAELDPEENPLFTIDPDALDGSFVNALRTECGLAAARNYGVCGSRIARQHNDGLPDMFPDTFCDRADRMDPDADIVVVFGGTNDFGHGNAPFGSFSDRTDETFCGALHVLYRKLIERYPEAEIVICTPLHRAGEENPRGEGTKRVPGKPLIEYVKAIRAAAEYYSLPLLDLYACSGLQPNIPVIAEKYCPDGLHPNKAGYTILTRRIKHFLESL